MEKQKKILDSDMVEIIYKFGGIKMIKIDIRKGIFEVSGEKAMILTELSKTVKELYESGMKKESLERSFKHAFMSDEELQEELLEKMKEIGIDEKFEEFVKKIFGKEEK